MLSGLARTQLQPCNCREGVTFLAAYCRELVAKHYIWENFGRKIFGKPYRQKLLVRKSLVNKATVSAYAEYIFGESVNIGEENFGGYI